MSKFTVRTYSPQEVQLVVGGYLVAGWDNITISRTSPLFRTVQGIRGKHTRVKSGDTSASLTFALAQTSQSNDVLSQIAALDDVNGTGRLVLTLKDNSGGTVIASDEGYITAYPETVFTGDIEMRLWNIQLQTTTTFNVGGNVKPMSGLLNSALNSATSFINGIF